VGLLAPPSVRGVGARHPSGGHRVLTGFLARPEQLDLAHRRQLLSEKNREGLRTIEEQPRIPYPVLLKQGTDLLVDGPRERAGFRRA
jgi:hypothetical protein